MKPFVIKSKGGKFEDGFDFEELVFFSSVEENADPSPLIHTSRWRINLFFFNGLEREVMLTEAQHEEFIKQFSRL